MKYRLIVNDLDAWFGFTNEGQIPFARREAGGGGKRQAKYIAIA